MKNLYVIASHEMEGRDMQEAGRRKRENILFNFIKDLGISYSKNLASYYQKVPSSYMNKRGGGSLPDSEKHSCLY
ncbi:hypothetical protein [Chryseobacterium indoltheticum]|uniref:hypothetical protein n=1 Tax=Chryseobacterium indoltheticum TaxID=254 RepID=UPI003F49772A